MAAGAIVAEFRVVLMAAAPQGPFQNFSLSRHSGQQDALNQVSHFRHCERDHIALLESPSDQPKPMPLTCFITQPLLTACAAAG